MNSSDILSVIHPILLQFKHEITNIVKGELHNQRNYRHLVLYGIPDGEETEKVKLIFEQISISSENITIHNRLGKPGSLRPLQVEINNHGPIPNLRDLSTKLRSNADLCTFHVRRLETPEERKNGFLLRQSKREAIRQSSNVFTTSHKSQVVQIKTDVVEVKPDVENIWNVSTKTNSSKQILAAKEYCHMDTQTDNTFIDVPNECKKVETKDFSTTTELVNEDGILMEGWFITVFEKKEEFPFVLNMKDNWIYEMTYPKVPAGRKRIIDWINLRIVDMNSNDKYDPSRCMVHENKTRPK